MVNLCEFDTDKYKWNTLYMKKHNINSSNIALYQLFIETANAKRYKQFARILKIYKIKQKLSNYKEFFRIMILFRSEYDMYSTIFDYKCIEIFYKFILDNNIKVNKDLMIRYQEETADFFNNNPIHLITQRIYERYGNDIYFYNNSPIHLVQRIYERYGNDLNRNIYNLF